MKKLLAITALALSGCALPSQQSATPMTPEQTEAMTAYNAEIDNANAERERERIAEEAIQAQRLNAIQSSISRNMPHYMPMPASPTVIQVQPPVDQYLQ